MAQAPLIPFDYLERQKRREQQQPDDPVAKAMGVMQVEQARSTIIQAPDPDTTAKVTRAARETGEPPALVEDRLGDVEKAQRAEKMGALLDLFPVYRLWAQENPRGVVAASDDHKALGILGGAWDWAKAKLPGTAKAAGYGFGAIGAKVNAVGADYLGGAYDFLSTIGSPNTQTVGDLQARQEARKAYWNTGVSTLATAQQRERPKYSGFLEENVLQGLEQAPASMFAALAGAVTRSPSMTMMLMGAQTGAPAVYEARQKGLDRVRSGTYGFTQASIEVLTEKIPATELVNAVVNKTPFGKALMVQLATEIPQEQVATVLQDLSEWATLNPDKPFSDYVAARPEAALSTLIQTAVGTTVQTAAVKAASATVEAGGKVAERVTKAQQAKEAESFFDRVERAAAQSKLNQRDPQAYAEMVQQTANDSGIDQVYLPAAAIRAYQQSDSYDQFEDPFSDYQAQIDEADAVGGDVVLPAGFALGALPGTAAWSAIKGDLRLAPGGMSSREAEQLQSELDDVMSELTDQAMTRDREQQGEQTARGQIIERVTAMLQNAGFTPANAAMQAELIAQREATRAARMGRGLTGNEFTTEVTQVLPPSLGEIVKADQLDLVVNALRKKTGPNEIAPHPELPDLFHGGMNGMSLKDIKIIRKSGQKQGKKGRVYGGFYATSKLDEAQGYADMSEGSTVYRVQLRPDAKVETKDGDVTRLTEAAIAEYRNRGVDVVVGKDPRGRTEYVVINEASIAGLQDTRKGRSTKDLPTTVQRGKSLLEWIAARGGIEDRGGDIKAMGGDKWHREKVGRRKLLKDFDAAQGNMLGGATSDNSVERLLDAAISEGFFPDLYAIREGGESIDNNVLLEAIGQELSGSPLYSQEAVTDNVRAAADDLAAMLAERGLVASEMTDAEIRAAVAQMGTEGAGDVVYDQLPESIEIDGVARPTRNSEGMPLAGSEEGLRAFWAWFGDSKVVDEEGRPLVVYHGTRSNFQEFARVDGGNIYGDGFYFTTDPRTASDYATGENVNRVTLEGDAGPNVMPVYLRMDNPFVARGLLTLEQLKAIEKADNKLTPGSWKRGELARMFDRAYPPNGDNVLYQTHAGDKNALLRKSGFDGLDTPYGFVAFSPTQIKSINNRGTFDPADARILYQISPDQARETNVPVEMPSDPLFTEAVGNTPGALVTADGLVMDLVRFQKPEQEGAEAVRTGVFYLPAQSADVRHYRNAKTGYGGKERFAGPTLIRRPLFVKGATGGAAPEQAFKTIKGKEAFDAMSRAVTQVISRGGNYIRPDRNLKVQLIEEFIDQYAPEQSGYGDFIESVSREGNTLRYALQELAVAHAVREAGYDAVVSYSKGKAGAKISEVFDVREQTFPARGMESQIHDRFYNQAYGEGPRGRILMDGARPFRIELFQARNLSTLLHELSHQWLEELRADAESPDAPDQIKADWQAVQDWFAKNGHPVTDGVIPVEAHEMWARGGERYLMEGKSPSSALQRLFETFRGWLLNIYKTVDALRAPITPEIREVFDRLLATDEEIAAMAEMQALTPMFKDAAAIGMTGEEFGAYTAQAQAARDDANATLLQKTMAAIRRRETKKFNDERNGVKADEAERLDQEPLLKSIRLMRETPIDQEWLIDRMGQDVLDLLPKRVPPLWREGGTNPDTIAELAGFGSGQQMIEVLIGAERQHRQAREGGDQRTLRARMIDNAADAEMTRRYGDDPLNDGSIEQEAIAAVNGELQGELLASEVRLLSRRTGKRPTPYKIARQWARNRVRTGLVSVEASPGAIQRHARNVAKAGRDAEKAMLAGKMDEALRFKQQQMLSSALLAEAKLAHDEVQDAVKRMGKIAKRATMKSVDQDYLEQAHALLEAVDLKERTQKSIERQGRWEAWSAAREAEGYEVVVPPSFEATLGRTNWSRLPVETLLGLDEAVAQVMHLGRLKQSLLDRAEQREWDEIFGEAESAGGNIDGPPPKDMTDPGWWDALKGRMIGADAALLKMETVFDWLDGGDPNGVFNRIAFRPIADAQAREQDMLKDYYGRIKALFEAVPADVAARWQDKLELPFVDPLTGAPARMNRHKVIAMALNVGNEGNLQRLSDGYGWNPQAIEEYLNATLTAEEWQFVQGVWDTIDTLWPEVSRIEREVNGVAPDKVEAREVVTPFGTLRGGYYPAVYDSTRDYKAEENRGRESDLFEGAYTRATTRASATKERAEKVKRPLLLDLGVINRHLGEVIHDVTHREAVIRANRFLTNERVMRTVDEALGPEIRKQFRPWLKFVANSWAIERAGNEGFGKFIGQLRANATVVAMGLRATTMVTQIAGYSNSIEVVGEAPMAKALAQFSRNPAEAIRWVMEASDEVRNRMETLDRDIRTELARLNAVTPVSKVMRQVIDAKRFVFHGIGYMDRLVSVPTWIAGYNNALAAGMDEQDARYAGDKAVRQSQGAGGAKDLAAIQRGTGKWGEALKLFTMFYSYFSAQYQRQRTLGRDVAGNDQRRPRSAPKLAARAFFLLVLPPLLTEVLRGAAGAPAGPDDDEWWAQWTLRKMLANMLGPIPLVRDVFEPTWNAVVGNKVFNPSISPLQRAMDSVVKVGRDVGKLASGDDTKSATKDVLELTGYATGLVPGQVASATQFLVDVGSGDADPQGFGDWVEGLSTGKLKED